MIIEIKVCFFYDYPAVMYYSNRIKHYQKYSVRLSKFIVQMVRNIIITFKMIKCWDKFNVESSF